MHRSRAFDCIMAALIGMIATGATIWIIWAAAIVMKAIGGMPG